MKGALRLLLLGVALAIFAGGVWWTSRGKAAAGVEASGALASETGDKARPPRTVVPEPEFAPVAVDAVRRDPRISYEGERNVAWIDGRVVVPPATPADERLRLRFVKSGFAQDDPRSLGVIPETDGSFRLPFVSGRTRADIELEANYLRLPPRSALDLLDLPEELILEPVLGARLLVRVTFPDGVLTQRLDEIDVALRPKQRWGDEEPAPARSEEGVYAFHGVQTQQPMLVQVEAASWVDQELELDALLPGESRRLDLVLSVGAAITGRILDEAGDPVTDLVIEAKPSDSRTKSCGAYAITERDGSFELLGVPSGRVFLSGEQEGFLDLGHPVGELSDGERLLGLELTMSRGETLEGLVTWPDGQPVSRARVRARVRPGTDVRAGSNLSAEDWTQEDGSFRIERLSPGSYELTANAAASGKEEESSTSFAFLEAIELPGDPVTLVLRSGSPLLGRVVDDRGEPVAKFGVVVSRSEGSSSRDRGEVLTKASFDDAGGEFRFPGLPRGRWLLTAKPLNRALSNSEPVEVTVPGREDPLLVCRRQATVAGVVLDRGGAAVAGAHLLLSPTRRDFGLRETRTWTDNQGRFLQQVESGTYVLTARQQGSAPSPELELELAPGDELRDLVLSLSEPASLLVRLDPGLGKIESRSVSLFSMNSHEYAHGQTDRTGTCRIDDLAAGEYTVALEPFGSPLSDEDPTAPPRQLRQIVELVAGQEGQVVLGRPSDDAVRIHGRVSGAGEPVAGERLMLSSHENRSLRSTETDSEGLYEFVVAGGATYDLRLGDTEADLVQRVLEVPAQAETLRLDIALPSASLAGVVLRFDGSPCAGAQVTLNGRADAAERRPRTISSDASGRFEFRRVEPGSRQLFAFPESGSPGGFKRSSATRIELAVKPGEQVDGLELKLAPVGSLQGRVHDSDGSVAAGVRIEVLDENLRRLHPRWNAVSDRNGRFKILELAPGTYRLRAMSIDSWASGQAGPVRVRAGETVEVDLNLSD